MNPLVTLAKKAVESYVNKGEIIKVQDDLPGDFLKRRAGTFVTIEENSELRGCIGTYLPMRENIAEEIIYNAIAAATEDYRFGQIIEEELTHLSYAVYILSEPKLTKNISELDPKKFGIIVKTAQSSKCGLLLPDLDGIDTAEGQLAIACRKGGINPSKEKILIYKFTAEKFT